MPKNPTRNVSAPQHNTSNTTEGSQLAAVVIAINSKTAETQSHPEPQKRRPRKQKTVVKNVTAGRGSLLEDSSNTGGIGQSVLRHSETVSMALIPQIVEPQSRLQLLPRQSLSWRSSATTKTPAGISPDATQDAQSVQSVVQRLRNVSIAQGQTTTSSPESALQLNVSRQTSSRSSKSLGTNAKTTSAKHVVGAGRGKAEPSRASGGVPDPSDEYMKASLIASSKLSQPQHLLIVIDLNGTLLYRPNPKRPTKFHMRPHAHTFLKYCVDKFKVVIWSSARPENVSAMCTTILSPDVRSKVVAVWARDTFGLTKSDFDLRVQCYKKLSRIWQDREIAQSHPEYHNGIRWDQTNTVLIDDSREKARSEPHNLVEVPEWFGDLHERSDILPQVHDYINHLSLHSNVSACLQSNPWRPTVF